MTSDNETSSRIESKKVNDHSAVLLEFSVHRKIVINLFLTTLFLILIVIVLIIFTKDILTTLLAVMLAGVLGSFVSALRRIYKSVDVFPRKEYLPLLDKPDSYLLIYSLIPPLVGAIFAGVTYVLFAAGMISGPLFPEFKCEGSGECRTFSSFLHDWEPQGSVNYAKAIIWGFVSGFSERFVPNLLGKLSSVENGI